MTTTIYSDGGKFVSFEATKRGNSPYVSVTFTANSGNFAGKDLTRGNFATSIDKESIKIIKTLSPGDDIILKSTPKKVGDKTYRNLVSLEKGVLTAKKFTPAAGKNATDYNDRAAKGQALNLAMQVAIAEGKATDDTYILSLVPRMLKLGEAVQNGIHDTKLSGSTTETTASTNVESSTANSPSISGGGQSSTVSSNIQSTQEIDIDDLIGDL